jgi:integrase
LPPEPSAHPPSKPIKLYVKKAETKPKQISKKSKAKVRYHSAGNIKVGVYQFWEEAEGRKMKNFTKPSRTQDADVFATNKVKELTVKLQGGVTLLQGEEANAYAVAKKLLANDLNNVPLVVILREVIAALACSGAPSLMECAKLYRAIHGQVKPIRTDQAVAEFLTTLKQDTRHHDDLKSRLKKFNDEFGKLDLLSVRRPDLERWLAQITHSPKTFTHYHGAISQFMTWAQKLAYLPETTHEAKKVIRPKPRRIKSKECFTPEELIKLLAVSMPREIPTLVLQAFMGLRLEELCAFKKQNTAIEWKDILWEQNAIHIREEVGKTGERYIHNMPDNLRQWLLPFRDGVGNICPFRWQSGIYQKITQKSGVKWKNNGLRHGFGFYRMALTKDYNLVSEEMGNSPEVLKRDYRVPKTEQEAQKWFAITPEVVEKYRKENGIMTE